MTQRPDMSVLRPLYAKLARVVNLTSEEAAQLEHVAQSVINLARGTVLGEEHLSNQNAYVVISGWTCCYKSLRDGSRQIVHFPLPGDIIGLRSIVLGSSDHSYSTLTDAVLCRITGEQLRAMMTGPGTGQLAAAFLWLQCREEAIAVERLVDVGRRTALERLGHFLLEIQFRLEEVGLADADGCDCPLHQEELADTLGLSVVHVNRSLRELREQELVTFRNNRVEIHDRPRLEAISGFNRHYLEPTSFLR